jgi:hypothetical protein
MAGGRFRAMTPRLSSSRRTPGPISVIFYPSFFRQAGCSTPFCPRQRRWLWVPAFAGTTLIPGITFEKLQALTEPQLQLASIWQALVPPEALAA